MIHDGPLSLNSEPLQGMPACCVESPGLPGMHMQLFMHMHEHPNEYDSLCATLLAVAVHQTPFSGTGYPI